MPHHANPAKNPGQLTPVDLRCNHSYRPLAVGDRPVRFSWLARAHEAASADHALFQAASQLRICTSPEAGDAQVLWDSGKVASSSTCQALPKEIRLPAMSRLVWSVRIWDQNDNASAWAAPEPMEVGPCGREDFSGTWIGPSTNLFAHPLPKMGRWMKAPRGATGDATTFMTRFDLLEGFPRCVGTCWVAAGPDCRVILNSEPLEMKTTSRSATHPAAVSLPWDKLKRGTNTLALTGPAASLAQGVSCMARIWQAEGGYVVIQSGERWTVADQPAELINQPPPAAPIDNGPRRSVELSRQFVLHNRPALGRVYATGLGTYELFINGKRVGDELLAPGWTDYDTRLHYAAHDVTDLLIQGENHITARLGNAWWSSGMGWEHKGIAAKPGQPLRLLMDLITIDREGQTQHVVTTDRDWQWRPSEIQYDTIYHGQTTDQLADPGPWQRVALLDDGLSPAMEPAPAEPIRVIDEIQPISCTRLAAGSYLYDFGQNHSGRPRLRATLPAGTRLQIRHCEVLDKQGKPYFENYRTAAVTDTLVVGNTPVDWSPGFTYRGYRYAVLSGLPHDFEPNSQTLSSEVLHNDVSRASSFECSNPLLNQIDAMIRWGLRTNFHSVPTDCPQRDERLGWTGDVQLIARTSCWMFELHGFYKKWLVDLVDAQREDGGVTHIAPFTPVLPNESAPIWGDVITTLPDVLDQYYDDRELLVELYEPMRKWVGWYEARAKDGLAEVGGFGDWVALEETPSELCGTAYFAYSCQVLARIAKKLGHAQDAATYAALAKQAAHAYHEEYFDAQAGHYQPDTQTAQLLGLAFDLTPKALRQSVADHLASLVAAKGDKPATGFVGTTLLLPTLSRFGHHELAYRVLNTRAFPSLGYMIDQGATTVWERWNTDKEGPAMNSRNHFCLGGMAQWLYEDLVGIRPDPAVPGFRHVLLQPQPAGDLTFATVTYQSPQGTLQVQWEIRDGQLHYNATLPPNVTATLHLPSADPPATTALSEQGHAEQCGRTASHAVYQLGSGQHQFSTPALAYAGLHEPA